MSDSNRKGLSGTLKDLNDYLGQLATLAAGSIVVLGTFAGSTPQVGNAFAVAAVSLFAYSIVATVLARVALIFRASMEPDDADRGGTETLAAWALTTGLMGFAFGVVALAAYAVQAMSLR